MLAERRVVETRSQRHVLAPTIGAFIDRITPRELAAKPFMVPATDGGDRHALMGEHQLRLGFGVFMAHDLPTAVNVLGGDSQNSRMTSATWPPTFEMWSARSGSPCEREMRMFPNNSTGRKRSASVHNATAACIFLPIINPTNAMLALLPR
ncbi:hypothetical protein HFO72_33590 [Rhizobium laguerreae]|nr:hypothetical protein [Rhizobium laguerreae]